MDVTNIHQDVEVGVDALDFINNTSVADIDFSGGSGSDDSGTVALYPSALDILIVDDIETLNLDVEGASGSTIWALNADSATTLNIGGARRVTIKTDLASGASNAPNIDRITVARGAAADVTTGNLDQDVSFTSANGDDTIDASGLSGQTLTADTGSGGDTIKIGDGDDTVDAGAGDDNIFLGGELESSDDIDGGDGSDVILDTATNIDNLQDNDDALGALSSVEGVGLTNGIQNGFNTTDNPLDLTGFGDAGERVILQAVAGGAAEIAGLSAASVVEVQAGGYVGNTVTLTVPGATDAGNRDDTLTLDSTIDLGAGNSNVNFSVAGINTLKINSGDSNTDTGSGGDALVANLQNDSSLNTIDVGGVRGTTLDLDTPNYGGSLSGLETVDASDANGNLTLDVGAGNFGGNEGVTVAGGSGDDTITGTGFGDNITLGDGDDTVIYDANSFGAADNITDFGGSGNDQIFVDLTSGTMPMTDNNQVSSGAGGPANGTMSLGVFTTGTGSNSVSGTNILGNATTGSATTLSSAAQLFTASSFSALRSGIIAVANARAANTGDAGNAAFGFSTGSSQLFIFSFTDADTVGSNGTVDLARRTNTIATLGNGSVAFDDIAIF